MSQVTPHEPEEAMPAGAGRGPTRWPLGPLAAALGIQLGVVGGQQPGPRQGLVALAQQVGVSHTMVKRLRAQGLSDSQADRYAAALGYHPVNIWPDWLAPATDGVGDGDWYTDVDF